MALPELAVMQQAFELLHQLDPKARRRVLKWVKAALDEADPSPVPAPAEHIDAGARQVTESHDISVVDEPAVDTAGEPAAAEGEASFDDRNKAPGTPSPAPAADPPGRRTAKTAVKPTRGRAKTKTATPAAEASSAGGRGRPPAEDIMRVYQQVDGKLTELAKHYGKPYGTIQGWASTLREQGYPIGRSRKA